MKKYMRLASLFFVGCMANQQLYAFSYLYAPWRTDYITNTAHQPATDDKALCVFCKQFKEDDTQHFVLARFEHHVVMLNRYPYNTGHLLIMPLEHYADLEQLSYESRIQLMELATASVVILKKVLGAHGVNVGLNLGRAAGAGIPGHVHMHVLPRYEGDTGYLGTTAETKLVPVDLRIVYEQLKPFFEELVM